LVKTAYIPQPLLARSRKLVMTEKHRAGSALPWSRRQTMLSASIAISSTILVGTVAGSSMQSFVAHKMLAGGVMTDRGVGSLLLRKGVSITGMVDLRIRQALCPGVVIIGILTAVAMTSSVKRHRRVARHSNAVAELDDQALIQAGLRNLLGVEEQNIAQKLEKACQLASDMERCKNDIEVKHRLALEELSYVRHESEELKAVNHELEAEKEELSARIQALKVSIQSLDAEKAEMEQELADERTKLQADYDSLLAVKEQVEVDTAAEKLYLSAGIHALKVQKKTDGRRHDPAA